MGVFDKALQHLIMQGQGMKQIGLDGDAIKGKAPADIPPFAQQLEEINRAYRRTLDGETVVCEVTIQDQVFEMHTAPVRGENDEIIHGILIAWNVTHRHQLQKSLQESYTRYRLLATSIPDLAMLMFDHNLRYVLAAGQALERVGFDPEHILDYTLDEVLPEERVRQVKPYYQAALRGKTSMYNYEYDGRTYRIRTLPIYDDNETIYAGMLVAMEITESETTEDTT